MKTYAHVSYNEKWEERHNLYVVHGTAMNAKPRRMDVPLYRYVQAAGSHKSALTNTTQARAWAKETIFNGWDGIYLDVMDWRNPDDIKIAKAIRDALDQFDTDEDCAFVVNGHPFHVANLSRHVNLVDKALSIADGFQFEGARLGQAKAILPKHPFQVILWLVFGDIDDTKHRREFEQYANHNWEHYYGRRPEKVTGEPQDPR